MIQLVLFSVDSATFQKTCVFFSSNVATAEANGLGGIMGFTRVDDLGIYPGMPLFHKKVTCNTFQFVIDKVRKKLLSCCRWLVVLR